MNPEIVHVIRTFGYLTFGDLLCIAQVNVELHRAFYGSNYNKLYKITPVDYEVFKNYKPWYDNIFLSTSTDLKVIERYLQIHGYSACSYWAHDKAKRKEICSCNVIHWYYKKTYTKNRKIIYGDNSNCVYYSSDVTPLHLALFLNNTEKAKLLINYMTNNQISYPDKNGHHALHIACYAGEVEILKILLDRGITGNVESMLFQAYNSPASLVFMLKNFIIPEHCMNELIEFLITRAHDASYDRSFALLCSLHSPRSFDD